MLVKKQNSHAMEMPSLSLDPVIWLERKHVDFSVACGAVKKGIEKNEP